MVYRYIYLEVFMYTLYAKNLKSLDDDKNKLSSSKNITAAFSMTVL